MHSSEWDEMARRVEERWALQAGLKTQDRLQAEWHGRIPLLSKKQRLHSAVTCIKTNVDATL